MTDDLNKESQVVAGTIEVTWSLDYRELKQSFELAKARFTALGKPDLVTKLEDHLKDIVVSSMPNDWVDLFINGEEYFPVRVHIECCDNNVEIEEGFDDDDFDAS